MQIKTKATRLEYTQNEVLEALKLGDFVAQFPEAQIKMIVPPKDKNKLVVEIG